MVGYFIVLVYAHYICNWTKIVINLEKIGLFWNKERFYAYLCSNHYLFFLLFQLETVPKKMRLALWNGLFMKFCLRYCPKETLYIKYDFFG